MPRSRSAASSPSIWPPGAICWGDETDRQLEAGAALGDAHGFFFWAAGSAIVHGHALARCDGRAVGENVALMKGGIDALRQTGALLALPAYLTLRAGRDDDAERALAEAEALPEQTPAAARTEELRLPPFEADADAVGNGPRPDGASAPIIRRSRRWNAPCGFDRRERCVA